jgi:hypothetical protein
MQDNDFRESVLRKECVRQKTGQIVSSIIAESKSLHVELLRRQYSASARSLWRLRQPSLVPLWNRSVAVTSRPTLLGGRGRRDRSVR